MKGDVTKIDLITLDDPSEMYAEARPMMNFRPTYLWVNGERYPLPEHDPVPAGQLIRARIPQVQVDMFQCAFCGEEFRGDETTLSLLPAAARGKAMPGKIVIRDQSAHIVSVSPMHPGRIVGLDLTAHALCATCAGHGRVGRPYHEVTCPTCEGKPEYRSSFGVQNVFIDDICVGLRSEMSSPVGLPLGSFHGTKLRLGMVVPGQLMTISIRNSCTMPVEVFGKILFEEDEPPMRPTGEGGGGLPHGFPQPFPSDEPNKANLSN